MSLIGFKHMNNLFHVFHLLHFVWASVHIFAQVFLVSWWECSCRLTLSSLSLPLFSASVARERSWDLLCLQNFGVVVYCALVVIYHCFEQILRKFTSEILVSFLSVLRMPWCASVMILVLRRRWLRRNSVRKCAIYSLSKGSIVSRVLQSIHSRLETNCLTLF